MFWDKMTEQRASPTTRYWESQGISLSGGNSLSCEHTQHPGRVFRHRKHGFGAGVNPEVLKIYDKNAVVVRMTNVLIGSCVNTWSQLVVLVFREVLNHQEVEPNVTGRFEPHLTPCLLFLCSLGVDENLTSLLLSHEMPSLPLQTLSLCNLEPKPTLSSLNCLWSWYRIPTTEVD